MNERTAETEAAPDDLEVQIHQAVIQREQSPGSFPDADAVEAMEEPLHRLMGAAVLFTDLTMVNAKAAVVLRGFCGVGSWSVSGPRRCRVSSTIIRGP